MNNYSKSENKHKTDRKNGAILTASADSDGTAGESCTPYLTRINKSTSTPVKFEIIIDQIDDILASDLRYIKFVRSWLLNNSKGALYE